ncbi:hypothetical protein [Paenarthrobacter sp. JL.01a]|uniref:sunset domain-containing protein n=1 Tax=Paenarthrobacter sp. JL.01a TaxID=2979324 RepID=UPI0021C641C8|nr:hypothetical protein [Paenarthrobacter sp. JL.01a]UXM90188.1 hypothetical protein N5P29_12775 [Paenarthrobacter sp. JL.01a]
MDWLIWVIVIVLVVAIVWWLMSRNKASNSTGSQAPAAMEPTNTATVPDPGAVSAGVAGLAGVTNPGKAAAEGSGPTGDEPTRREADAELPADEPDVEPAPAAEPEVHSGESTTPGLTVEEPVVAAPMVDEPVVAEPVVDTEAKLHSADAVAGDVDDWQGATTADDVTRAEDTGARDTVARDTAMANEAADKAEWESSWTDAAGGPIHHHEYTDPHSPTLPGAETAAAEDAAPAGDSAAPSGHLAAEEPYGTGSSSTLRDGHPVKAIAATMTYHDEDAADYDDVEADVWFISAAHAEAAGFRPPRRSRH